VRHVGLHGQDKGEFVCCFSGHFYMKCCSTVCKTSTNGPLTVKRCGTKCLSD
jgi:hypothetical protein